MFYVILVLAIIFGVISIASITMLIIMFVQKKKIIKETKEEFTQWAPYIMKTRKEALDELKETGVNSVTKLFKINATYTKVKSKGGIEYDIKKEDDNSH